MVIVYQTNSTHEWAACLHRSRLGAALNCLSGPARRLVVGGINRFNPHRPGLAPGLRRQLTAEYRREILQLQGLTYSGVTCRTGWQPEVRCNAT